jgi:predicted site-specific integrase-resolvase
MSLVKTWFTLEEAVGMFGVSKALLLEWVDEGLVRSERKGGKVVRVNIDDVKLQVDALVHRE